MIFYAPTTMPQKRRARRDGTARAGWGAFVVDQHAYRDRNSQYQRVTPEQLELCIELHKQGESLYAIAQRLGIKYSTLKNRMQKGYALTTMDAALSNHEELIRDLKYTQRLNCREIQNQLGQLNVNASKQALYKFLRRLEPIDKSVQCSFIPDFDASDYYCEVECDVRNDDLVPIDTE